MSSKEKIDVKSPDAFLSISEKVFVWLEKHAKLALTIVAGALGCAVIYVGYGYFKEQREANAAEALYRSEAGLRKAETDLRESRAKKMQDKVANPVQAAPTDFSKDFGPSVESLKSEIVKQANSRAALVSSLNLVAFLVQHKQYEMALSVLEIPKYRPAQGDDLSGFFNMHRGLVLLENKKFDEAAKAYEDVLKAKSLRYLHPEALLKVGLTYELKGDTLKAKENYEKLQREFPATEAAKSGLQYLRLMDSKSQQG